MTSKGKKKSRTLTRPARDGGPEHIVQSTSSDSGPYEYATAHRGWPRGDIRWVALVFSAAILAYLPALRNGLVWDDTQLLASDLVTGRHPVWFAFTQDYWNLGRIWSDSGGYYRPLTVLSLRLDYLIGHGAPLPFHVTALFLHGIASAGVYHLARRFGTGELPAGCAAILFAVQPHHAETVAWISGRPDLLLSTTLIWSLAIADGPRSYILGGCALLCKETAVVWPLLAAIREQKLFTRARFIQAGLALSYLTARAFVLGENTARFFALDLATGVRAFLFLLGTWLWPPGAPYAFTPITAWSDLPWQIWLGLAALLLFALIARSFPNTRKFFLAAALCHAPAALIMSSQAVLGMRPLYLASAFLAIGIALPLSLAIRERVLWHLWLSITVAAILAVTSASISMRWRDDLSFQSSAAASAPASIRVQLNFAMAQMRQGFPAAAWRITEDTRRLGEYEGISFIRGQLAESVGCATNAVNEYEQALASLPNFAPAHDSLVRLYGSHGHTAKAEAHATAAKKLGIDIAPTAGIASAAVTSNLHSCPAEEIPLRFGNSHTLNRMGSNWLRLNRLDLAGIVISASLRLDDKSAAAQLARAQLSFLRGEWADAIKHARNALAIDPRATPALKILGLGLLRSGQDSAEGRAVLGKYLELVPNSPDRSVILHEMEQR